MSSRWPPPLDQLLDLADAIEETVYLLHGGDARFDTEGRPESRAPAYNAGGDAHSPVGVICAEDSRGCAEHDEGGDS
jgi:hypothetical protein